jgi:hypothetical protein
MLLVWSLSLHFLRDADLERFKMGSSDIGDLATVLFGAASVALFIFSILVALLAIFGWQSIQSEVRSKAEEAAKKVTDPLKSELMGRTLSIQGYLLGESYVDPETFRVRKGQEDALKEAIYLCQQAYEQLKKIKEGSAEYMALNNLIYYTCVSQDLSRKDFLCTKALELKRRGQEHDVINLLLTACRVMVEFGNEPERLEAKSILTSILERRTVSTRERAEAAVYLEWLRDVRIFDLEDDV